MQAVHQYKHPVINGFTRPPHPFQLSSYALISFVIVVFYTVQRHILQDDYPFLVVLVSIFFSLLVVFSFATACIDPSDPTVQQYRIWLLDREQPFDHETNNYWCDTCDSWVSKTAKHCRRCNRCVDDFDHHCKWVNNCIGKRNYRPFVVMIASNSLLLSFLVISSSISLYLVSRREYEAFAQQKTFFSKNFQTEKNSLIGLFSVHLALSGLLWFMNTNLCFLHMYLKYLNLTTFEYIMLLREHERLEQQLQEKMAQEQMNGVANALELSRKENDVALDDAENGARKDDAPTLRDNPENILKTLQEQKAARQKEDDDRKKAAEMAESQQNLNAKHDQIVQQASGADLDTGAPRNALAAANAAHETGALNTPAIGTFTGLPETGTNALKQKQTPEPVLVERAHPVIDQTPVIIEEDAQNDDHRSEGLRMENLAAHQDSVSRRVKTATNHQSMNRFQKYMSMSLFIDHDAKKVVSPVFKNLEHKLAQRYHKNDNAFVKDDMLPKVRHSLGVTKASNAPPQKRASKGQISSREKIKETPKESNKVTVLPMMIHPVHVETNFSPKKRANQIQPDDLVLKNTPQLSEVESDFYEDKHGSQNAGGVDV